MEEESWTHTDRYGKEVTGRFATTKDIPGILAVRPNTFEGRDYLPVLIHDLMKNPNCKCFVMVREQEIIGFRFLLLREHNRVIYSGGGRIKVEFEKKGYLQYMNKPNEVTTYPFSNITDLVWTGWLVKNTAAIKQQHLEILYTAKIIEYGCSKEQINRVIEEQSELLKNLTKTTRPVTPNTALQIALNDRNHEKLFGPTGHYIGKYWMTPEINSENLRTTFGEAPLLVASYEDKKMEDIIALSYSYSHPCPDGFIHVMVYLGEPDIMICKKHMIKHFQSAALQAEKYPRVFPTVVFFQEKPNLSWGELTDFCTDFSVDREYVFGSFRKKMLPSKM